MGWTIPKLWTVGEMVTFTTFNVQLRDNLIDIGTGHTHDPGQVGRGSASLVLDSVFFQDIGGVPLNIGTLQRNPDAALWRISGGTVILSGLNPQTTAALLRVGTIEATTGGTIGADGTHNHII